MFIPKIASNSNLNALDFSEAQPWCNFVLFRPQLSEGSKLVEQQFRPESPFARSSYRCLIASPGRKLSIKQFLYDWAPPAYDHPSLWRNNQISSKDDTPIPRPFQLNGDMAWIGLNFRRQPALSLNIKRTMIEMTCLEGSFSDEELIEICQGLKPVDSMQANQILQTSFASLCYSTRHETTASEVPLSYWKYNRQKAWSMNSSPSVPPISIPSSYKYSLNSIFSFGTPTQEIEYYYEHQDLPGSYLRLLVTPLGKKHSIKYPPKLGDQSCCTNALKLSDQTVYHAFLTESFGPHEVIWRHRDSVLLLLIKPAAWTSLEWLHQLVREII